MGRIIAMQITAFIGSTTVRKCCFNRDCAIQKHSCQLICCKELIGMTLVEGSQLLTFWLDFRIPHNLL